MRAWISVEASWEVLLVHFFSTQCYYTGEVWFSKEPQGQAPPMWRPSRCLQHTALPRVLWKPSSVQDHGEKKGGREEETSAEHTHRKKKKSTVWVPEMKNRSHWSRWELCHQISMETEFHPMWTVLWKYLPSRHTVGALLALNTCWKGKLKPNQENNTRMINQQTKRMQQQLSKKYCRNGWEEAASPLYHGPLNFARKKKGRKDGCLWCWAQAAMSRLHGRQSTEIQKQEEEKHLAQIQPWSMFPSPMLCKEARI